MRSLQKMYMISEEHYRLLQDCIDKYDKKRLDEFNRVNKPSQTDLVDYINRSAQYSITNPDPPTNASVLDRSIQASLHNTSSRSYESMQEPQNITPPQPPRPSKKRPALSSSQEPLMGKKIILDHDPLEDEMLRPAPLIQPEDRVIPHEISHGSSASSTEFLPPRTSTPIPPPPPIPILPLGSCQNIPTRSPVKTRGRTTNLYPPKIVSDFKCDYCGKRFNRRWNLTVHVKTQHEDPKKPNKASVKPNLLKKNDRQIYQCPLCLDEFDFIADYKFHLKNLHSNQLYKKDFEQQKGGSYTQWNL